MSASKLSQDPHKVRDNREKNLETAIGREVREFRHQRGMTVADLAQVDGSVGWDVVENRKWRDLGLADHIAGAVGGAERAGDGVLSPI